MINGTKAIKKFYTLGTDSLPKKEAFENPHLTGRGLKEFISSPSAVKMVSVYFSAFGLSLMCDLEAQSGTGMGSNFSLRMWRSIIWPNGSVALFNFIFELLFHFLSLICF